MNVRTRSIPTSLASAIVLAVLVAVVAGVLLVRLQSASDATTTASGIAATATEFGLDRDTITTTPGANVTATIARGPDMQQAQLDWSVSAVAAGTSFHVVTGTTATINFVAPASGSVLIHMQATRGTHVYDAETSVVVADAAAMAATNVTVAGNVRVNGAPAIAGEALVAGTRVNAENGEITFVARASSSLSGLVAFSGTSFTLGTRSMHGGRVLTTLGVTQQPGSTSHLHAAVQHLDGVRYIAVQTPDAVAMVKGTEFDVAISDQGTRVSVTHGLVLVLDRYRLYRAPVYAPIGTEADVDRVGIGSDAADWNDVLNVAAAATGDMTPGTDAGGLLADGSTAGTGSNGDSVATADADNVIGTVVTNEVAHGDTPVVVTAKPTPTTPVGATGTTTSSTGQTWCGGTSQPACSTTTSDGSPSTTQPVACGQSGQPACPGTTTGKPTGTSGTTGSTGGSSSSSTGTTPTNCQPNCKPVTGGSGGASTTPAPCGQANTPACKPVGTTPTCGPPTNVPCSTTGGTQTPACPSTGCTTTPPPPTGTPPTTCSPSGNGCAGSSGGTTTPPTNQGPLPCGTTGAPACPQPTHPNPNGSTGSSSSAGTAAATVTGTTSATKPGSSAASTPTG